MTFPTSLSWEGCVIDTGYVEQLHSPLCISLSIYHGISGSYPYLEFLYLSTGFTQGPKFGSGSCFTPDSDGRLSRTFPGSPALQSRDGPSSLRPCLPTLYGPTWLTMEAFIFLKGRTTSMMPFSLQANHRLALPQILKKGAVWHLCPRSLSTRLATRLYLPHPLVYWRAGWARLSALS